MPRLRYAGGEATSLDVLISDRISPLFHIGFKASSN